MSDCVFVCLSERKKIMFSIRSDERVDIWHVFVSGKYINEFCLARSPLIPTCYVFYHRYHISLSSGDVTFVSRAVMDERGNSLI